MKVVADTNVLLRAFLNDDPRQSPIATRALAEAETVVLSLPVLCEFVWVLTRIQRYAPAAIAELIRSLVDTANVTLNLAAVEAGLAHLDAGGDFADGVIAHEGWWLGGETLVSFDKQAVQIVEAQGRPARLLA